MRTNISAENLEIFKKCYQNGMTSKGRNHNSKHIEAAMLTGLDIQVVKEWTGNYRKKVSGTKYQHSNSKYIKGMTAYNCFVKENKDKLGGMKTWSRSWMNLPPSEKIKYRQKAVASVGIVEHSKRTSKQLLRNLLNILSQLNKLGVDLVCLGNDEDGKQIHIGLGAVSEFFINRPSILEELHCSHDVGSMERNKVNLVHLRKKAQVHMNNLYGRATGKYCPFPYKSIRDGSLVVTGIPDALQPLRPVSSYGKKNLEQILLLSEIEIYPREHDPQLPSSLTGQYTHSSTSQVMSSYSSTADITLDTLTSNPLISAPHHAATSTAHHLLMVQHALPSTAQSTSITTALPMSSSQTTHHTSTTQAISTTAYHIITPHHSAALSTFPSTEHSSTSAEQNLSTTSQHKSPFKEQQTSSSVNMETLTPLPMKRQPADDLEWLPHEDSNEVNSDYALTIKEAKLTKKRKNSAWNEETCNILKSEFHYFFQNKTYPGYKDIRVLQQKYPLCFADRSEAQIKSKFAHIRNHMVEHNETSAHQHTSHPFIDNDIIQQMKNDNT